MLNASGDISNPLCLGLLQAVLEQVDYGLAVVNTDTRELLFANAPARTALHPASELDTYFWVADGKLRARQQSNKEALLKALAGTKTGKHSLLNSVAIMPLAMPDTTSPPETARSFALLAFPKQQRCDTTTVSVFAQERGLTGAEGQVLKQVCRGMRPQ